MTAGFNLDFVDAGPLTTRLANGGPNAYYHSDHLTSRAAETRTDGTVNWREHYTPFGERLIDVDTSNGPGFTDHVHDAATGLNYMQARYYDPIIGRFLQTDPIGYQDQLNLYAYVANDPMNAIDPNGEFAQIFFGALVGAAFEAGAQLIENGGDFSKLDGGKIATSAVLGAATGGTFLLARTAVTGTLTVAGKTVATLSKGQRVEAAASAVTLGATEGIVKEGLDAREDGRTPELGRAAAKAVVPPPIVDAAAEMIAAENQAQPQDQPQPDEEVQ